MNLRWFSASATDLQDCMKPAGCGVLDSFALGLLAALVSEASTPLYCHPALRFCKDSLTFSKSRLLV